MNITKNLETKQLIIDSLLSIPGMLRASDLELKPHREEAHDASAHMAKAQRRKVLRRQSANDDIYQDTPRNRVERIQRLIRTPLASSVLALALEREALKDRIATGQTSPGRSWAAIIYEATRRAVTGDRIPEAEADLVRLGVVLASMQQLVNGSDVGEDEDWVYRESKAARAHLMELDPEAGLWLRQALGHGPSDEELSDKAKQLLCLVWQGTRAVGRERSGL